MSIEKQELGGRGEKLAAAHLEGLGWQILEQRWRCKVGELDLVAEDGETVVFVEVRTRAPRSKVPARANFGAQKQRQIAKVALFYVRKHELVRRRMRFDVVAVELGGETSRIEHVRNAFALPHEYW